MRGIEPRPRRWERRILATRPHGIEHLENQSWFYEDCFCTSSINGRYCCYPMCLMIFLWKKCLPPVRGIEPRPRRWKRRILATRPHGIWCCKISVHFIRNSIFRVRNHRFQDSLWLFVFEFSVTFTFSESYWKFVLLPCGESNPGRGGENAES